MDLGQCRCWSVCCSWVVKSFVVLRLFLVDGPWTLANVIVGQCVVHWLFCHSSFVVGSLLVDHGSWSMSLLVSLLFAGCYVIHRSYFVVCRSWTLVNVIVGQCVLRWLCDSSFIVGSLLVDHGRWSMSLLVSVLFVSCYVIRCS